MYLSRVLMGASNSSFLAGGHKNGAHLSGPWSLMVLEDSQLSQSVLTLLRGTEISPRSSCSLCKTISGPSVHLWTRLPQASIPSQHHTPCQDSAQVTASGALALSVVLPPSPSPTPVWGISSWSGEARVPSSIFPRMLIHTQVFSTPP